MSCVWKWTASGLRFLWDPNEKTDGERPKEIQGITVDLSDSAEFYNNAVHLI